MFLSIKLCLFSLFFKLFLFFFIKFIRLREFKFLAILDQFQVVNRRKFIDKQIKLAILDELRSGFDSA